MKSTPNFPNRPVQRGQAIVLFLAMVAACCCVFALVYNVGQMTNKKEETVNAADAAALSGALVEARVLNFQAYTNRAMVANEVTIAQMVSLESWMNYNNQLLQNIETYTAVIPYIDDATSALADASEVVTEVMDPVARGAIAAAEVEEAELSGFQEAAYLVGSVAAKDASEAIAAANTTTFDGRDDAAPQLTAGLAAAAMNESLWSQFAEDNQDTAKNIILESRDPFSTKRGNGRIIDAINDLLSLDHTLPSFPELIKTSGTTTLKDNDHWEAQDSLDTGTGGIQFTFGIPTGFGDDPDEFSVPLGYGRADAGSDDTNDMCDYHLIFGRETNNCDLAEENSQSLSYQGLRQYNDLKSDLSKSDPCSTNNASDGPSVPYVMAVQKAGASTQSTQNLGMNVAVGPAGAPQGSTEMTDNLQNGNNLTAISAACVFFLRPDGVANDRTAGSIPRLDGQHESASLYNPYWQARLSVPDPKLTAALYVVLGLPGLDQAQQLPAP